MRYRTDPPEAFVVAALDTLTALYHRRSGQTHLVAEPVPEILAALSDGARDIGELLDALAIDDAPDARAALAARLDEMIATGLVAAA